MTNAPDRYTHGHHASVVAQHARRTAEVDAAYLLPRLRSGMRLLDVGCGPGTITVGLARAVAPGETVGVDLVPEVVEEARVRGVESGLESLRFETADAYALEFEAGSFDAVHAHQVLQHVARPVEALREWRRVLRSGGLVAVRDADYGTMTHWPPSPQLDRFFDLYREVTMRNGADANAGRRLAAWVREAGFVDIEVSATTVLFSTPEAVANWGLSWADRSLHSSVATQAVEYGLATHADLETIAEGWRAWVASADAFFMYVNVEVLGRAP
ncbi:MAG: methyltransferase domain-containing protein [Dehalococcoidia bacterium]